MKNPKDIIHHIIEQVINFPIEIFLFGSRAQNNSRTDSDYDILVGVDADIPPRQLIEMLADIRHHCAKIGIDIDIIVRDRKYVFEMKGFAGNIINEALISGIHI